ncbi:MAG: leucine-rich repeat domain-containing protein, partial [Bacilli bacterium]
MKNKRNVLIYVMTILAFAVTSCHPLSSTYSPDSQISAITSESTSSSTSEPSTVISYSVIFKNYDGTILQSTEWEYGTMPSYNGNDPTREADSCFSYSFKGWSPEIQSVTAEATYVATYNYISNGTMTFNFEEDTYLIVHCSEEVTEIDIPSSYDDGINGEHPVTSIGTRAFSGCTLLTSITIPDNITSLGGASFFGCTSLTSVVISDSLTTLSTSLFSGCSSLTDVTLPRNLTYINTAAFVYCTSLAEISIPNTVTSIHVGAFSE